MFLNSNPSRCLIGRKIGKMMFDNKLK